MNQNKKLDCINLVLLDNGLWKETDYGYILNETIPILKGHLTVVAIEDKATHQIRQLTKEEFDHAYSLGFSVAECEVTITYD